MSRALAASTAVAVMALIVAAADAQLPTTFKNLQVLPKDIPPRELVDAMKGFTSALDVRCNYCHVHSGNDPDDLAAFDFASDDKGAKRAARTMLRMVRAINEEHLARLEKPVAQRRSVGCVTCHQGKPLPATLEEELAAAVAEGGIDAATRRYRELRERYYGRSAYDFGADSLLRLGRRLAREGRPADAVTLLRLNREQFPQSQPTLFALGDAAAQAGDRAAAIAAFESLLALDPKDPWGAGRRLAELRAGPAPAKPPQPK